MKRYIKANTEQDFNYEMLKPLIKSCTDEGIEFYEEEHEGVTEYEELVAFATDHVEDYLKDLNHEDLEKLVRMYIDGNYNFKK